MFQMRIAKNQIVYALDVLQRMKCGMTLVELMVTVLIVAMLSVTLGAFFVKLLNIHEQEREEGYVREKLVDICGACADYLSVSSSISNVTASSFVATYREETGGVSLETGRVSRVTHFQSFLDTATQTLALDIGRYWSNNFVSGFSRDLRGDAYLMNLTNDLVLVRRDGMVEAMLTRLNGTSDMDASLFYLKVSARCERKSDKGKANYRYVTAGRIVRLWNKH